MKRPIIILMFLTILAVTPLLVSAADSGLIFCNTGTPDAQGKFVDAQGRPNDCDFSSLVLLIQKIITFVVKISTVLAALGFVYAGFLLITDRGSESGVKKAKAIFTSTAIGFAYILGAWLIVYTIVSVLVDPQSSLILLKK